MKKYLSICLVMFSILLMSFTTLCYGYENDSFKIDVPSDYIKFEYSGIYMFAKNSDKANGFVIYLLEDSGLKKNISSIKDSDIDALVQKAYGNEKKYTVLSKGKEKLGKNKAVKIRLAYDDAYSDLYLLASDKHVFMVTFVADSLETLNSSEYKKIKKSFKVKERITNPGLVKGFVIVALLAGGIFIIKMKADRRYGGQ